jgi:hypothetical protein
VKGGGIIDLALDGDSAFELKPMSWQYGSNYQAALDQLNGYLSAGGYAAGSWSALGLNSQAVGISGTWSAYGVTFSGSFIYGPDAQNSNSGLLFYAARGTWSFSEFSAPGADVSYFPTN